MTHRFEVLASIACLVLVGAARLLDASAQGLPTPAPGGLRCPQLTAVT